MSQILKNFHLGSRCYCVWILKRRGDDIQRSRPSYGCLFSIHLGDPGGVVDRAPNRPRLVLARLAVT